MAFGIVLVLVVLVLETAFLIALLNDPDFNSPGQFNRRGVLLTTNFRGRGRRRGRERTADGKPLTRHRTIKATLHQNNSCGFFDDLLEPRIDCAFPMLASDDPDLVSHQVKQIANARSCKTAWEAARRMLFGTGSELRASPTATMANSGESGTVGVKELVYLAISGLAAVGIYFAWQFLGFSNSHLKPGHESEPTESLNDH